MSLNCDGCGAVIRRSNDDDVPRVRVTFTTPKANTIFGEVEGYDFCNIGCVATWATQRELETRTEP